MIRDYESVNEERHRRDLPGPASARGEMSVVQSFGGGHLDSRQIVELQRLIGNHAVTSMIHVSRQEVGVAPADAYPEGVPDQPWAGSTPAPQTVPPSIGTDSSGAVSGGAGGAPTDDVAGPAQYAPPEDAPPGAATGETAGEAVGEAAGEAAGEGAATALEAGGAITEGLEVEAALAPIPGVGEAALIIGGGLLLGYGAYKAVEWLAGDSSSPEQGQGTAQAPGTQNGTPLSAPAGQDGTPLSAPGPNDVSSGIDPTTGERLYTPASQDGAPMSTMPKWRGPIDDDDQNPPPIKTPISDTYDKPDIRHSGWLKNRLPDPARLDAFMKWLKKYHPREEEEAEEHPHANLGPVLEGLVDVWESENPE